MTTSPVDTDEQLPAPSRLADVPGWFFPVDQLLFDWFLTRQRQRDESGDLLEVGVYLGKSAIFSGAYVRDGDRFTVCDLFDSPAEDSSNSAEMAKSYSTLTRRAFEANYLSFHDELPTVVQGPSSFVPDHVDKDSCRFVHIDASHLYDHVHADIVCARTLLRPHGIVALDDFRAEHCPGVAAATWQAVTSGGLQAVCITSTKFYGTWGDPGPVRDELLSWLSGRRDLWYEVQSVAGGPLIRVDGKKAVAPPHPASRHPAADLNRQASAPAASDRPRPTARRLAARVLPSSLAKAVSAARRRG
ncbi:class I SAM-dependent methyltransferase [Streptantibioticus ferralitis]|uniref:Class I SAM-dependent methyltransferase n=1 Tax=Streptantibioticus ferralitis TaxID=236510 RepID=A0ABT5YZF4_9ACTN|nr:class I SAM-dependent methyltransferase [Streptantibioticus ferralitis]MDF2256170.1 class I SAM-dependent methyltransferase [Streptantibioticus ferralitis]